MRSIMHRFLRAQDGTTAIEYALLASLIAVAIAGAVQTLGHGILTTFYDKLVGYMQH